MRCIYSYNNFQCVDISMSWLYNIACWELAGCSVYIASWYKSYCCFWSPKTLNCILYVAHHLPNHVHAVNRLTLINYCVSKLPVVSLHASCYSQFNHSATNYNHPKQSHQDKSRLLIEFKYALLDTNTLRANYSYSKIYDISVHKST